MPQVTNLKASTSSQQLSKLNQATPRAWSPLTSAATAPFPARDSLSKGKARLQSPLPRAQAAEEKKLRQGEDV